jgi:hypothetical protein
MLRIEEFTACSFLPGKSLRIVFLPFSAHVTPNPSPVDSWPPSLVPTWETTAWTGMCFVHVIGGAPELISQHESIHGAASLFQGTGSREANFLAARARAPP